MNSKSPSSRRQFLKGTAAAIGFPTIVPASVFGQNAPSNRITMGVVGWGMQGPGNTGAFMNEEDCQVVAACDLDKKHLETAIGVINKKYGNSDCKAYHDYRELMARRGPWRYLQNIFTDYNLLNYYYNNSCGACNVED